MSDSTDYIDAYLSELIVFGGVLVTRGTAIVEMQNEGHHPRLIDAYVTGGKTVHPDLGTGDSAAVLPLNGREN